MKTMATTITREELTHTLALAAKAGKNIDQFVEMMKGEAKYAVPSTSKNHDVYWKSKYTTYRSQLAANVTKLEETIKNAKATDDLTEVKKELSQWQKLQNLTHLKTKNRGKTKGKNSLLDMLSYLDQLDNPNEENEEEEIDENDEATSEISDEIEEEAAEPQMESHSEENTEKTEGEGIIS